ncbi:cupin domain-containing protein [Pseudocnuella soli]|uniref:cupin domain-containing protein n=1 Tax=Pseudocnuella soli TaxID=2502779 RepID=UPI001044361B|nr:cupin domain-containing protein [Pseudocnuella soli]
MEPKLPHTIQNVLGETLTFQALVQEPDGDKLLVENFVAPQSGPPMHTHYLQDEALTVVTGRIGYQVQGEAPKYAAPGETVVFKRGTPHRFWNAGTEVLHCTGWVKPANTLVYFLSAVYAAQNKTGTAQPEKFDAAYLLTRYASEYDMNDIPPFVRKVIIPLTYRIGKLLGKYDHFKDAPQPTGPHPSN